MRRPHSACAIGLAIVLASAPAAAQSRQEQQTAAELRMVQEQQQLLALAIAQLAETLKTVTGSLDQRLNDVIEQVRKVVANLELTIKGMANDMSAIRAQTQDTGTRLGSLKDEIEALRTTVDGLPAAIAQLIPPPPTAPADPSTLSAAPGTPGDAPIPGAATTNPPTIVTPPPVGPRAPVGSPTSGTTPQRMLERAKADYYVAQHEAARLGFEQLIRAYPPTEAAAEAQVYIGNSYSQQGKYADAVAAYSLAIQNYPKSQFLSEAHYRRGVAYEAIDNFEAARTSFEFVVKNYPADNEFAILAKGPLDRVSARLKATAKP